MSGHKPPSVHPVPQRVIDSIMTRVDRRGPKECWPWKLSLGSHGYGQVGWWNGKRSVMTTAHRVVWIAHYGPIPLGMTIDHRCRNHACCNPRHLRLRTNFDNARDNGNWRKSHCKHGHRFTKANTRVDRHGWRRCRTCQKITNDLRKEH